LAGTLAQGPRYLRLTVGPVEADGGTPRGRKRMWLALFTIAAATAICLSVAAVMVEARPGDILRG
jgi:hypothetical protein